MLHNDQTDVRILDKQGQSALEIASKNGFLRAAKLLLRCPKTQVLLESGQDYMHHGPDIEEAFNKKAELMQLDPTCCTSIGDNLLKAAWQNKFREIQGSLLCPAANINTRDIQGRTPIYVASMLGHIAVLDVLLGNSKIDTNIGTYLDGDTPFSIASKKGHFKIMKMLIKDEKLKENQTWNSHCWAFNCIKERYTGDSNVSLFPTVAMSASTSG